MNSKTRRFLVALPALALGACTTMPNADLVKNFQGATNDWPKQPVSAVTFQPISAAVGKKSFASFKADREKRGYALIGGAAFTGEQASLDEVKRFAASVGADTVYGGANLVGSEQRSNMVLGSYTPGSYSYTTGTATGSATGSANTSGTTPWGPMNFNTSATGTSYGTYNASTYNSPQMTFVRNTYEVPITQQMYMFYVSPQGVLRHWMKSLPELNASKPPGQQMTKEEWRQTAVNYAAARGVPLPADLSTPIAGGR